MSAIIEKHLGWSEKQRRILTANDKAEEYYVPARGFPYDNEELPHFQLLRGGTYDAFSTWKNDAIHNNPVIGVWKRPLFYGGFEHSTDQEETVYNVQTNTLFIDLRIPVTKKLLFQQSSSSTKNTINSIHSLEDMNKEQLCWFARQHVFAGYSHVVAREENGPHHHHHPYSCTRHHCIDWNFVGKGRSRPNKWWIELPGDPQGTPAAAAVAAPVWKEWAFATDPCGQYYYCERWERWEDETITDTNEPPVVSLRRISTTTTDQHGSIDDGVIVVVGDHFNYCLATSTTKEGLTREVVQQKSEETYGGSSLVGRVDAALEQDDFETARALLGRIQAGHGRVKSGWKIDCAIEFWKEGQGLWTKDSVMVTGEELADCKVTWNDEEWVVFESSNLESVQDLRDLLWTGL